MYRLLTILLLCASVCKGQMVINASAPYRPLNNFNPIIWLDASNSTSYSGSGSTWFDLSGNSANGTLTGSPTFNSTAPKNFLFNGSNQYVNISNKNPLNYNGDISITTWFKLASLPSSGSIFYSISDIQNISGADNYLRLKYVSPTDIEVQWGTYIPSNDYLVQANIYSLINTSSWFNLTVTCKSGVWTVFLNGSFLNSATTITTYSINTASIANIMTYNNGSGRYFNGYLSQIQYYNFSLTTAQASSYFDSTKTYYGY